MPWKDPEKQLAHQRMRYWMMTPEEKQERRERYKRSTEYRRNEHLKVRYRLTLDQRDAIFEAQGKCCAICKSETSGWKRDWHTDHDHKTGRLRGVLCHSCNRLLGTVKDDVERLRAFIEYLEKNK